MELIANELSIDQSIFDSYEKEKEFSELYLKLKKRGITTCRIDSSDMQMIINSLPHDGSKRNLLNLIYAFLRTPFEEGEKIESKAYEYYESEWKCCGKDCLGLAMSYLTNGISFSFDSQKWPEAVRITRDGISLSVRNIAARAHIDVHTEWIKSFEDIELIKSNIDIGKKIISLRDDHGKDILTRLSKRIVRSPYVEGVVNSLPFNGNEKHFIKSINENGIVECVLTWTDEGYGLAVQTTGRNRRETEKIAELLRLQFSK